MNCKAAPTMEYLLCCIYSSFYSKLPICLISELYQSFIDAIRIEHMEKRMVKLKRLIHELPEHHFETFKHFAKHLNRVAIYGDVNRVSKLTVTFDFSSIPTDRYKQTV